MQEFDIGLAMANKDGTAGNRTLQGAVNSTQDASMVQEQGRPTTGGISEGIWAWDVPNNRVYWSSRIYEMLGMPWQESPLTIEAVLELVHPENRENLKNIIQDSLKTGDSFEAEFRMGHLSGAYRSIQLLGRTYLDRQQMPLRMSGLVIDVTEQKKAEESVQRTRFSKELEQQTERITALEGITLSQRREIDEHKVIESELKQSLKREELIGRLVQLMSRSFDVNTILDIAVREIGSFFGMDRCRVIQYEKEREETIKGLRLSAQYCRSEDIPSIPEVEIPWELVEFLKAQSTKKHPLVFLNASDSEQLPPSIRHHLESHGIQSAFIIEIEYRDIPFGWLTMHQATHPRVWTEQEVDFLKVLTAHIGSALYQAELYQQERQAKQTAEEANRQKSKVLSFVSHDFKNPLDSIMRFIDILEKDQADALPEKHRELIGYIEEGVTQLRYMVTDILDKARLEEGRVTPMPERIELQPFIDELSSIFNSMASQRNVQVRVEIQPELAEIKADPTHLRQILINLISNAVKYNQVNGQTSVRFYPADDKRMVVIDVQDTGIGIPPEKIPQLFTEYYRADLLHSDLIEGTGLGLAFVKKLVELQGGNISVDSEVGVGSIFKVTLPVALEASDHVLKA